MERALVLASLLFAAACRGSPSDREAGDAASATIQSAAVSIAPPSAPPLAAPAPFALLPIEQNPTPVVSLALGATSPRPIAIAAQGIFDKPQWQCDMWRDVLGNRGFILCPRGTLHPRATAKDDRYVYASDVSLEREIDAGLAAISARYGPYVKTEPILYTGFSQGANMGIRIVARHPARYPRVVLIEGGWLWNDTLAATFAQGGGERVLFACGSPSCVTSAREAARVLGHADVEAKVVAGEWEGHSYFGKTREAIRSAMSWVTEGRPEWTTRE
jgi:predicted esterase